MDDVLKILLDDDELAPHRIITSFKQGDIIAQQGDHIDCLYWIVMGECHCLEVLPGSLEVAQEWSVGVGGCIGVVSALTGQSMRSRITASTDVECIGLTNEFLTALGKVNPDKTLKLLMPVARSVCLKTRGIHKKIVDENLPLPVLHHTDNFFSANVKTIEKKDSVYLSDSNLNQIDFFSSLTVEERLLLLEQGSFLSLNKNQLLLEEQSAEKNVYVVIKGALQTFFYRDQRPLKLTVVGPGHKLGTVIFVDGKPTLSGCIARENTEVFCLSDDAMTSIKKENPLLAAKIKLRLLRYLIDTTWQFNMHYAQAKSMYVLEEE